MITNQIDNDGDDDEDSKSETDWETIDESGTHATRDTGSRVRRGGGGGGGGDGRSTHVDLTTVASRETNV